MHFVRNVVCGLIFTVQLNVSSLEGRKLSVVYIQCSVKSPNFCRSAERGEIAEIGAQSTEQETET